MNKALIDALTAAGDDKEKQAAAIQTHGGSVYQLIFQNGHDVGYGKKHGELTTAQTKATELEGRVATLSTELTTLKSAPDQKALHDQYGAQIKDLTTKAEQTASGLKAQLTKERKAAKVAVLRDALLTGAKRVEKDYADVLIQRADVVDRVKMNEDGTWQVLQKGKEIPIAAQTPDAALTLLADELKAETPPKFLLVGTDTGAGTTTGTVTTTVGGNQFDKIREAVKAEANAPNAIKPHGSFAALASPTT